MTNNHAPKGLATNWLPMVKVADSRALALGRFSGATTDGSSAPIAVSARLSPVPRRKSVA
ncbi:hypothetical protein ACIA8G_41915 [Lentzea sp. NPDC051213]|uniref:hypothetical protein n=1 Tax=Lentzea sp. NPDC051213 TaxID=3364126 RepID=UPI0037BAEADC